MKCSCGGETKVSDSRPLLTFVKRKRTCLKCGEYFFTIEKQIPRKLLSIIRKTITRKNNKNMNK